MKRWILLIIALMSFLTAVWGQEFQESEVSNFSGGLVNSISNSVMRPNQALVLDNYDIDKYGNLKRRPGMRLVYSGSAINEYAAQSLISYYGLWSAKSLLVMRNDTSRHSEALAKAGFSSLFSCDDGVCTTFVAEDYYQWRSALSYPYSYDYSIVNNNLVIANSNTELSVYDGSKRMIARPYITGQPRVHVLNGAGTVTGSVRYRYIYSNDGCPAPSTPSYSVTPVNGMVFVDGLTPAGTGDTIRVYREDNFGESWHLIDSLVGDTAFIDSMSLTTAALQPTIEIEWFPGRAAIPKNTDTLDYDSACPGGINVSIADSAHYSLIVCENGRGGYCHYPWGIQLLPVGMGPDTCTNQIAIYGENYWAAWSVVFVDSAGRASYMSPPTIRLIGNYDDEKDSIGYWVTKANLTNIPVPSGIDSASIEKKYLLRAYIDPNKRQEDGHGMQESASYMAWDSGLTYIDSKIGKFYIVAELDPYDATHTDSISFDMLGDSYGSFSFSEYCDLDPLYIKVDSASDTCGTGTPYYAYRYRYDLDSTSVLDAITGYCRDDSTITFQPSSIEYLNSRMYAIGDGANRNRIYMSDFGKPTTWPSDKFIDVPSNNGDWFNGLGHVGQSLVLFKYNSIYQFSGLTLYQYTISEISNDKGAASSRSIASFNGNVYFAHPSGIYSVPFFDRNQSALSIPIKQSIDSVANNIGSSFGKIIQDEYWFSCGVTDSLPSKTYIYNPLQGNWRVYDFGLIDVAQYDTLSNGASYSTDKYIFLLSDDSLYEWNYFGDTLDAGARIVATYQSKYFFDDGLSREKIGYLDFAGTGKCDSMIVTLFDNYGQRTISCDTISLDFTDSTRQRYPIMRVAVNLSVKLQDLGYGDYTLEKYVIGYKHWDEGKK